MITQVRYKIPYKEKKKKTTQKPLKDKRKAPAPQETGVFGYNKMIITQKDAAAPGLLAGYLAEANVSFSLPGGLRYERGRDQ